MVGRLRRLLAPPPGAVDNVGAGVGEWPSRAFAAASLAGSLPLPGDARVADLGCGRQTLRALLPTGWVYQPYDSLPRTPDTVVCDFEQGLPELGADLAFMLGVIEYLSEPMRAIESLVRRVRWGVISYCHFDGEAQRARQGWRNNLTVEDIGKAVAAAGGAIIESRALGRAERLYLVGAPAPARHAGPGLSLLSAAAHGDNSGDAIIEDAVRRLLGLETRPRLSLLRPLDDAAIEAINSTDGLVVCGTNLYQRVFAGNLTVEAIRRIRVPITLLGIGSSDAMGSIPRMDREGVRAVRLLHERAPRSSVRDEGAWRFLKSIGIADAVVTGCPVLFHGLRRPEFAPVDGETTVTPRARLLHVDRSLEPRQSAILAALATRYRPTVVLQSPYDLPIAEDLRREHGCRIAFDPHWQAPLYVALARSQSRTAGLRLHFSMLSLAYGRPATLVSHDSRAAEFCRLVGLPLLALDRVTPDEVVRQVDQPSDWSAFLARWDSLASAMRHFLEAERLPCRLAS